MKILFVLEYYQPHLGGVETLFQSLAEGLVEKGNSVRVLTSSLPGAAGREVINGVEVFRVPCPTFWPARYFFTALSLFHLSGHVRWSDVVHTTTFNAALPAWLMAKFGRRRVAITVHEVWGRFWFKLPRLSVVSQFLHWIYEAFVMSLPFDYYVCDSDFTRRSIQRYLTVGRSAEVIYPGVSEKLWDASRYDPAGITRLRQSLGLVGKFVYLYFGRFGLSKGVEPLLGAVEAVSQRIPDAKLVLIIPRDAGSGDRKVENLIGRLKVADQVLVLPAVSREELPRYLLAADCVVVPSLTEGFGFAAVEAGCLGRPVVVSQVGSLPEVVSGKFVWVGPGDPVTIADGVERVFRGRYTVTPRRRFPIEEMVVRYQKVFERLAFVLRD